MGKLLPIFALTLALLIGCTSTAITERTAVDGNTTPTMVTTDVNSFVSDSGVTRYHLTAPIWYMYDEADEPFWHFPEGLTVEQITINGVPADLVISAEPGTASAVMWIAEDNTAFNVSGFLSVEELIAVAESIQPKK